MNNDCVYIMLLDDPTDKQWNQLLDYLKSLSQRELTVFYNKVLRELAENPPPLNIDNLGRDQWWQLCLSKVQHKYSRARSDAGLDQAPSSTPPAYSAPQSSDSDTIRDIKKLFRDFQAELHAWRSVPGGSLEVSQLQNKIQQLTSKDTASQAQLHTMQAEIQRLTQNSASLQAEIQRLTQVSAALQDSTASQQNARIVQLESEIAEKAAAQTAADAQIGVLQKKLEQSERNLQISLAGNAQSAVTEETLLHENERLKQLLEDAQAREADARAKEGRAQIAEESLRRDKEALENLLRSQARAENETEQIAIQLSQAQANLAAANAQTASQSAQIAQLEKDIANKVVLVQQWNDAYTNDLSASNARITELTHENASLQNQLQRSQQELTDLQAEQQQATDTAAATSQTQSAQLAEQKQINSELLTELQNAQTAAAAQLAQENQKNQNLQGELQNLEAQLAHETQTTQKLTTQLLEAEKEVNLQKEQLQKIIADAVSESELQIRELETMSSELVRSLESLQANLEHEKAKSSANEMEENRKQTEIARMELEKQEMQQLLSTCQNEIKNLQEQNAELKNVKIAQLNDALKAQQQKMKQLTSNLTKAQTEIKRLKDDDETAQKIAEQNEEIANLHRAKTDDQTKILELSNTISRLQQTSAGLTTQLMDKEKLEKENAQLNQEKTELARKYDVEQARNSGLQTQLNKISEQLGQANELETKLQAAETALKTANDGRDLVHRELQDEKDYNSTLQKELQKRNQQIKEFALAQGAMDDEKRKFNEQIQELQEKNADLVQKRDYWMDQNAEADKKQREAEQALKTLTDTQQAEKKQRDKEMSDLQTQLSTQAQQLASAEKAVNDLSNMQVMLNAIGLTTEAQQQEWWLLIFNLQFQKTLLQKWKTDPQPPAVRNNTFIPILLNSDYKRKNGSTWEEISVDPAFHADTSDYDHVTTDIAKILGDLTRWATVYHTMNKIAAASSSGQAQSDYMKWFFVQGAAGTWWINKAIVTKYVIPRMTDLNIAYLLPYQSELQRLASAILDHNIIPAAVLFQILPVVLNVAAIQDLDQHYKKVEHEGNIYFSGLLMGIFHLSKTAYVALGQDPSAGGGAKPKSAMSDDFFSSLSFL